MPDNMPDADTYKIAQAMLATAFPHASKVTVVVTDEVGVIDPGANLDDEIRCPMCDSEIDRTWWLAAMDKAAQTKFTQLDYIVPCCGCNLSLNNLNYRWGLGFSRFALEVRDYDASALPEDTRRQLEELLGCELKIIWAHY
jgi:hypothetical protein